MDAPSDHIPQQSRSLAEQCLNLGIAAGERDEVDQALIHLDEAVRLDPQWYRPYFFRGIAHFARGDLDRSLAEFERACQLDPPDATALGWIGHIHQTRNDEVKALEAFNRAVALDPNNATAHQRRGVCAGRLGDIDRALADFAEAIRLQPHNPETYLDRADTLIQIGDIEAALADLDTLLRLKPDHPRALRTRAGLHVHQGEADRALADYDAAIRLNPQDADAHLGRGGVWESLDHDDRARQDYDEAIRLVPTRSWYYRLRANLLAKLGFDDLADADDRHAETLEAKDENAADIGELMNDTKILLYPFVQEHFAGASLGAMTITERFFPFRVGADLQRGLDDLFSGSMEGGLVVKHFFAPKMWAGPHSAQPVQAMTQLWSRDRNFPVVAMPPQYHEIDIGETQPVRCLRDGLWLLEAGEVRFAVLLNTYDHRGIRFEVVAPAGSPGEKSVADIFLSLEAAIRRGACYRGKILSLEMKEMYSGQGHGLLVHKLNPVSRDQVILPRPTLDLLDRNIVQFIRQRPRLAELGLATKKGVLFHGPPGTGKTHTIHYLAESLPGQTTFLIAAEQVCMLSEYMTLARLFQPSLVVIEDADLIARERTTMHTPGEEVLLNKLLNEMDGLRADADVLFILTTNRPEALEQALTARPGRIDQAIEFPLPDDEGRAKLVRLYCRRVVVTEAVTTAVVKKTPGVSAAFIKELMRRSAQFCLERSGGQEIAMEDVDAALEEMLFRGGALNRKLLGAAGHGPR